MGVKVSELPGYRQDKPLSLHRASQSNVPRTLADALQLAADLARENEELERRVKQLESSQYPEVLRPMHLMKLFGVGKSTVNEWIRQWEANPEHSPILNRNRQKGENVYILKSKMYECMMRGMMRF